MIPGIAIYKLLTTNGTFFEVTIRYNYLLFSTPTITSRLCSFTITHFQRLEYLIRPWHDHHHQRTTRTVSLNGGDLIDPAQIRLTSAEAIDEV